MDKLISKAVNTPELLDAAEILRLGTHCHKIESDYDNLLDSYRNKTYIPLSISIGFGIALAGLIMVLGLNNPDPEEFVRLKEDRESTQRLIAEICSPSAPQNLSTTDGKHIIQTVKMLETIQSVCLRKDK